MRMAGAKWKVCREFLLLEGLKKHFTMRRNCQGGDLAKKIEHASSKALALAKSIMAGRLQHNEGPSLQPMRSPEESLKELNQPAKYPPFLALQLVFRDYLQGAPPDLFNKCRLVSKQFKSAVEAAHPPYTWHINGERLNRDLQTVIHFITSEPRWKWVTKVRLSEADVSMTQGDFKLLVAALGARAWESLALVEVRSVSLGNVQFIFWVLPIQTREKSLNSRFEFQMLAILSEGYFHLRGLQIGRGWKVGRE